jgi:excinuclease ABC subunit C
MSSLKSILAHIPHAPGVYRFLNDKNDVIYVGKAIDLKKRVSSYFRKQKGRSKRLEKLVENTVDLEYTVVDSELEALILETNLIKSLRPKYNILMKDDKNYVYLKITVKEEYPRILLVRKIEKDGAKYFGPKTSGTAYRRALDALKKVFPYRHCQLFIQLKYRKTLNVADHMKRCFGTCVRTAEPEEYRKVIDQVVYFFEGKTDEIEKSLKEQMAEAASNRLFEKAALLRDRLHAIEGLMDTQRATMTDHMNRDVLGLMVEGGSAYVTLFMFRQGKLINQDNFTLNAVDVESGAELDDEEVLSAFVQQYYERASDLPREVLLPTDLANGELFEAWVNSMTDHRVKFLTPKRGKNRKLIDLAQDNAKSFARQAQVKWQAGEGQDIEGALEGLKEILKLPKLPRRIECYDISHLGGTDTVGSMVVFEKGFPKKADYRHFKLRSVQEKIDDYQAMGEVLTRRFRYLKTQPKYIRKPKKKELEGIREILEGEQLDTEDLDQHKALVVEKRKKIVGFIRLKPLDDDFELASMWVHPKHRGQGLGDELTEAILRKVKKGKVYTLPCAHLMDWYGAMGFNPVKKIPKSLEPKLERCQKVFGEGVGDLMVLRVKKGDADASFSRKPNLLVIDGGKGQLKEATKALKAANLDIPVVSLAKRIEEIFVPGKSKSIILPHETGELQMLQRLRDEAHRFALKHQRNLRGKRMLS